MGVSLNKCTTVLAAGGGQCLAASPNASNSNNFCNVNTSGTANNNNASNSLGVAPGFRAPSTLGG